MAPAAGRRACAAHGCRIVLNAVHRNSDLLHLGAGHENSSTRVLSKLWNLRRAVATWGLAAALSGCGQSAFRTFERADGAYRVIVVRRTMFPGASGGEVSLAPASVQLYDRQGRLLREAEVETAASVEHIEWRPDHVHIERVGDWPLQQ